MLEVGFDVALIAMLDLVSLLFLVFYCDRHGMDQEMTEATIVGASYAILITLIGYLLISRVLGLIFL